MVESRRHVLVPTGTLTTAAPRDSLGGENAIGLPYVPEITSGAGWATSDRLAFPGV
jgi:hypothetical protein